MPSSSVYAKSARYFNICSLKSSLTFAQMLAKIESFESITSSLVSCASADTPFGLATRLKFEDIRFYVIDFKKSAIWVHLMFLQPICSHLKLAPFTPATFLALCKGAREQAWDTYVNGDDIIIYFLHKTIKNFEMISKLTSEILSVFCEEGGERDDPVFRLFENVREVLNFEISLSVVAIKAIHNNDDY